MNDDVGIGRPPPDPVAVTALAEKLRRRDEREQQPGADVRAALRTLNALVRDLPDTDTFLLMPDAVKAWQVLRDQDADAYIVYLATVRSKCGLHLALLIQSRVGPPRTSPRRDIVLHTVADIIAQPPAVDAVDGLLPAVGLAGIIGPPSSGKSFFADHVMLSMAAGLDVLGRRTIHAPGVIVSAEGTRNLRLDAFTRRFGIDPDTLPVRVIAQPLDLRTEGADIDPLLEHLFTFKQEAGALGVVVLDTVARTFGGGDENSPRDMGSFVRNADRIWQELQLLVIAVHHTGKDETRGGRGHNSLLAAFDSELQVSDDNGRRTVTLTKLRDGVTNAELHFGLEVVDLGPHPDPRADGKRLTSCVVVPSTDSAAMAAKPARNLSPVARIALDALREVIADRGQVMPHTSSIPGGVRAVTVDQWLDRFTLRYGETKKKTSDPESVSRQFRRGKEPLQAAKLVGVSTPYCWLWS